MIRILALIEVDKEILFKKAETDCFSEAFKQEMGWTEESGIGLLDFEIVDQNTQLPGRN